MFYHHNPIKELPKVSGDPKKIEPVLPIKRVSLLVNSGVCKPIKPGHAANVSSSLG